MAARGRAPGFRMPDEHRLKIANSNILNYLVENIEGRREMSSTQVTAGIALLKKVMPDLAHNEHEHDVTDEFGEFLARIGQHGRAVHERT